MPSTTSNYNKYYASHHRRQSSQSQTNLPDLVRSTSAQPQSPSRSLVYLPSTAYAQPATQTHTERPRAASISRAQGGEQQEDPHDFYRQYQDPFVATSPGSLHQAALRTNLDEEPEQVHRRRKSSLASAKSYEDTRPKTSRTAGSVRQLHLVTQAAHNAPSVPELPRSGAGGSNTLRSRKSSFKDLVARFDSPEDVPPLPTQSLSANSSRGASPATYGMSQQFPGASSSYRTSRRQSDQAPGPVLTNVYTSAIPQPTALLSATSARPRKPLFGEILPSSNISSTAGYGINNARRRRGSEGSPMHSPNPMFPKARQSPTIQVGEGAAAVWYQPEDTEGRADSGDIDFHSNRPNHRRAQSDFSATPSRSVEHQPTHHASTSLSSTSAAAVVSGRRRGSHSRIPVSTGRLSVTSDSDPSAPSSRAQSKLEQRQHGQLTKEVLRGPPMMGSSKKSNRPKPQTPFHITSPGTRGRSTNVTQAEKSPSLRANIIAPPPKISPPLRSSRPRMPVSAATTTASRAKMAEKFAALAREHNSRKASTPRPRPRELTDIDLKARRLKITQALSRSREGEGLRGEGNSFRQSTASRTGSITPSISESGHTEQNEIMKSIPAVIVDRPRRESTELQDRHNAGETVIRDQRGLTQHALQAMQGQLPDSMDDMDSPTLGQAVERVDSMSLSVDTQIRTAEQDLDPCSAVTQNTTGTSGTFIDTEPQAEAVHLVTSGRSVLSQIVGMRGHNSASPFSASEGNGSDHADEESIQIMLRNTTYLDEREAVEKGYRVFAPSEPLPEKFEASSNERDSWTSSIAEQSDAGRRDPASERNSLHHQVTSHEDEADILSLAHGDEVDVDDDENPLRSTMASDAYTIVNIVLQHQSDSGVVDQEIVDKVYRRIIAEEPELADVETVDAQRIEQLCLQELAEYHSRWSQAELHTEHVGLQQSHSADNFNAHVDESTLQPGIEAQTSHLPPTQAEEVLSPPRFRSHNYKSSLDSAEDWADASPSVGDWARYAADRDSSGEGSRQVSLLAEDVESDPTSRPPTLHTVKPTTGAEQDPEAPFVILSMNSVPPRAPSYSPPPPPISKMPSIDHATMSAPAGIRALFELPMEVPRRVTSLSQMPSQTHPVDYDLISSLAPSVTTLEQDDKTQKRLKQRKNVLKELVDTEFTYERDLKVTCDIYKGTAAAAISEEDINILFGNVEQVQQFSKDFLTYLKQVVKPAYAMERFDRKRDTQGVSNNPTEGRATPVSIHSSTLDSTLELTDAEKDLQTRVGHAFLGSIADMERVYKEFLGTRDVANKRLEVLQESPQVKEWLKECSENSRDITTAWDLGALLVKPVQRITKYPLLLSQLVESTAPDHPDLHTLQTAVSEVIDMAVRINEHKKHTELLDSAFNSGRKRKDSDVRNGLTKKFGRQAEKLRQHVGINEMYEDHEYAKLRVSFDNNEVHLLIVTKDVVGYIEALRAWVTYMCEVAAAVEQWVDVGHSSHPQAESKLRQFAMVVRGINAMALPDHTEQILRKVIQPMERAKGLLERFKLDPKGLIQKREKKILDYNQARNKRDRGVQLDRKQIERMEQWEALNREAKERMKKLLDATGRLVLSALVNLIQLHLKWLNLCKQKFSAAMSIPLDGLQDDDIIREWQVDFDFQEASALALSICNGSLLAEAVNMVSFLTPATTLNGDESPRHSSSNSNAKRSISMNSEAEHARRSSGIFNSSNSDHQSEGGSFTFNSGRIRAPSAASGKIPKTPDMSVRPPPLPTQGYGGYNMSRPGTGAGRTETTSAQPPRLSLDTPSPSFGILGPESPSGRPPSASTFFSAAAAPSPPMPQLSSTGAGIFSSAMPMSDSPVGLRSGDGGLDRDPPSVLFTAASVYEFNIDRSRQEAGFPYLTYVAGEIFDVIAERGELWLARNQDDASKTVGWIWNKHFAKLAG